MSFQVIYLTGAPAAGKSTIAKSLRDRVPGLVVFDYGAELLLHAQRKGEEVGYEELRANSDAIITPGDVCATDERLIAWASEQRQRTHILVDTHAVTREAYGFRVTPFSSQQVAALAPTMLVFLYVHPSVVLDRIAADAAGRRPVDEFEAGFHAGLQGALVVNYAVTLGAAAYLLDSNRPVEETVEFLASRIERG